jgi:hypothetical protein
MHIKLIVRKIEDYILNNIGLRGILPTLNNNIRVMTIDDNLKKIFSKIPKDYYVIQHITNYCNTLNIPYDDYIMFTHNFNDIDVYLEMSGHITPILNNNVINILNNISSLVDDLILTYITDDQQNENLIQVQTLLKELEDMYHSK